MRNSVPRKTSDASILATIEGGGESEAVSHLNGNRANDHARALYFCYFYGEAAVDEIAVAHDVDQLIAEARRQLIGRDSR